MPWKPGAELVHEPWENGKCLWVKANGVSSHSTLCCFEESQPLSFQDFSSYSNYSNLSKIFFFCKKGIRTMLREKKNQNLITMTYFGTCTLLCFRAIQQDLCHWQNSPLIVPGFNQIGKNLSLLYFCDCTYSVQVDYQCLFFFFFFLVHSQGSAAAEQTRFMGRFPYPQQRSCLTIL